MSLNVIDFQNEVAAPWKDKVPQRQNPLSVVSVGRDKALLRVREDIIISRSDLRVRSVDPEQAEMLARAAGSRLWIFCFTVELPKLVYLACSIRRYSSGSRLLMLSGLREPGFEESLFHRTIRPLDGPEGFLNAVSTLALEA